MWFGCSGTARHHSFTLGKAFPFFLFKTRHTHTGTASSAGAMAAKRKKSTFHFQLQTDCRLLGSTFLGKQSNKLPSTDRRTFAKGHILHDISHAGNLTSKSQAVPFSRQIVGNETVAPLGGEWCVCIGLITSLLNNSHPNQTSLPQEQGTNECVSSTPFTLGSCE